MATVTSDLQAICLHRIDLAQLWQHSPTAQSMRYATAKILLLGESGVGKTGLGARLAHGAFKEQVSTHGQQFWVIPQLGATRPDGAKCEAILWDLAGQPDYKLVHTLFLDNADLVLLLYDAADRKDPLGEVEYWLKALTKEKRRCPALLVGARADRGAPSLTAAEINVFCKEHGIQSHLLTSALQGSGIDDLLSRATAAICWAERPATITPLLFKSVKDAVLALREQSAALLPGASPRFVLPLAEWQAQVAAALTAAPSFTEQQLLTATGHLAHHGFVALLHQPDGSQSLLLQPDLLNNLAASIILEARRNPRGLGALAEEEIRQDGGKQLPELRGLTEWEQRQLLDAALARFIANNTCFRQRDRDATYLIFPALIHEKRPAKEDLVTEEDTTYTVSGPTETIYAAIVVLLGYTRDFTRTYQWQHQAQYESEYGELCGLRLTNERSGEMDLQLYYSQNITPNTRQLFQTLFERFLLQQRATVMRYPLLSCTGCNAPIDRSVVHRHAKKGAQFFFCSTCGAKQTLPADFELTPLPLTGEAAGAAEQAQAKTRFETALSHLRGMVVNHKKPVCFISYAWGDPNHEAWVRKRLAPDLQEAGLDILLDVWENADIGARVDRFVEQIPQADFTLLIGTPAYLQKHENGKHPSVVAAESKLINDLLMENDQEQRRILPLLREGDEKSSFPPLARKRIYADFRTEEFYFASLFEVIRTAYGISAKEVQHLSDEVRGTDPRRRL